MNNEDFQKLKAAATAVENHGAIRSMTLPTSEILALIAEVEQSRAAKQEQEPAAWIIKYPDGVVIPLIGKTVPKAYVEYATPLFTEPQ